ncbi:G3E family GTPase [Bradyrhizobium ottawaense]|uniref:G3E family GTPase n=1 Tax=Bradyrhizobium ottawaense TaxID=931866 RepID=A0ABV4FQ51_9BRAD
MPKAILPRLSPQAKIVPDHDDGDDRRHIHQQMNVVDQHENDREQRSQSHEQQRPRRHQQQNERQRTAIDVEMAERVHEVLEEERRARNEDEQRQRFRGEAKALLKQPCVQGQRHQPRHPADREHRPDRHLVREQRDGGTDQRALDEAEMVVDQEMDVGDVRRQLDLVNEHADDDRRVDREQESPGIVLDRSDHAAPGLARSTSAVVPGKRSATRDP